MAKSLVSYDAEVVDEMGSRTSCFFRLSKPSLKLLGNVAESAVASLLTIPEQKF